jgi:hypothetical protein
MKKSISEKLAENLSYYVGSDKRCLNHGEGSSVYCFYSGKTAKKKTEGCFIGRMLSPKDRVKVDNYFFNNGLDTTIKTLVNKVEFIGVKIPKIIIDNVNLFHDFQRLHDGYDFWGSDFLLSEEGKIELLNIIKKYNLDREPFKKFLIGV